MVHERGWDEKVSYVDPRAAAARKFLEHYGLCQMIIIQRNKTQVSSR